ncbi:SRPBCC family protein [Nocardia carnea]|uniref:SRPBCC family protein n=1 Tax=Nocardia carnea TaxID=37328 RepID=UPI0024560AC2|nr:SRPBCC family protein [Nocardia carnea]
MRTKTDISFDVQADPSQVMDALMAVEMFAEWSPDFTDARVATRDDAGRPRRVFVQVDISNTPDMQVWEFSWSDHRMSWEVADSTRGIRGGGSFEVTGDAGGSQVVLHVEQHTAVPLPGFLAKRTVRRTYETLVENFTDYAEQFGESEAYDLV